MKPDKALAMQLQSQDTAVDEHIYRRASSNVEP